MDGVLVSLRWYQGRPSNRHRCPVQYVSSLGHGPGVIVTNVEHHPISIEVHIRALYDVSHL